MQVVRVNVLVVAPETVARPENAPLARFVVFFAQRYASVPAPDAETLNEIVPPGAVAWLDG